MIRKNALTRRIAVKSKELKTWADALRESASNRAETAHILHSSMKGFTGELQSTQKLWRKSGSPALIKIGLALIAFPDPTISDVIGSAMVAVGLIQLKMKNSALHVDDVYKTFPQVLKELSSLKQVATQ